MEFPTRQIKPSCFPALLKEIPDPPKELFIRGEEILDDFRYLAVVGSRKHSEYGKQSTEELISGLAGFPVVIVSGLAFGIDSIAHKTALRAGIKTVAIPGSGLANETIYPQSHVSLAQDILGSGGTLISEFPDDFQATRWSFPQRNRLMAGMSHATLVVEAGERSGTLITARLALDYNRDVFVVPGSIFSEGTMGSHFLLRQGAVPVTSSNDILQELGFDLKDIQSDKVPPDLSEDETRIFNLLQEPLEREVLVKKLDLPIHEINMLLSAMEIKGLISENLGKIRRKH